ncbi:transposase [Fervidobacterium riparium]|nr:transposase [Fervidobacterium riparium]
MPLITIRAQIQADKETEEILKDAMRCATKVYNGLLWHLREEQKQTGAVDISRKNLNKILRKLPRANSYYSMSVQLTRDEVRAAYKSFFTLKNKGLTKHDAPSFRPKEQLSPIKYVQSGFTVKGEEVTISLGRKRNDGIEKVSFRISHRPDVEYKNVRELSIIYDKDSGRMEARLVVEAVPQQNNGVGRAAVDIGETILMAAAFDDGTVILYSGRMIKSVRRYWNKVRSKLERNSRRWKEIAHKEKRQVEHLLHIATSHFIRECLKRGVREISVGQLAGIQESTNYSKEINQRLHAWPYRKLVQMLKYKGALVGISVNDNVDERFTSITCHVCGKALSSNRKHRGLYSCSCGWKAQADVNAALNIYERAYNVSPVKWSSGQVARPAVVSFRLGWHGVVEPKFKLKGVCAS